MNDRNIHDMSGMVCVCHLQEVSVPAVTTILDKCIYGDRAVITHILESDKSGRYPPRDPSEHSVVLRQLVKSSYAVSYHLSNALLYHYTQAHVLA